MKDKWNERYSSPEYIYGTEPNAFFKQHINKYIIRSHVMMSICTLRTPTMPSD
jgi:hypothetical protein